MSIKRECPYCLSPIDETDDTICCDGCKTLYHRECWLDGEGCCIRGCENFKNSVEIDVAANNQESLVFSREEIESAIAYRGERFSNPCLKCGRQVPQGSLYCIECTPELEGNQDAKNLGPLLIVLIIFGLVLALYVGMLSMPSTDAPAPGSNEMETNVRK